MLIDPQPLIVKDLKGFWINDTNVFKRKIICYLTNGRT